MSTPFEENPEQEPAELPEELHPLGPEGAAAGHQAAAEDEDAQDGEPLDGEPLDEDQLIAEELRAIEAEQAEAAASRASTDAARADEDDAADALRAHGPGSGPSAGGEDTDTALDARFAVESVWAELRSRAPEHRMAPRLEAMRQVMDVLGDPAHSAPAIHLTGTNGKTSTARLVEGLLLAHDLRVGRYTSPHLQRITERIAVDGRPVADADFVRVWDEIRPYLVMVDERLEAEGQVRLTEFEAMTALAFAVFADAPVDVMVLEVGLGGAWDATNVADADVAVFTPIDLDHTAMLGETVAEIAQEKAGIIKNGSWMVSAAQPTEAAGILLETVRAHHGSFAFEGVEFGVVERRTGPGGQLVDIQGLAGRYEDLPLGLVGEHQAQNASVAVAAVEAFLGGGKRELAVDLVRAGLESVTSPGRMELVRTDPVVLLDAAHNPHGMRAAAAAFRETFPVRTLHLVLGILADKDVAGILRVVREQLVETEDFTTRIYATASSSERAVPAEDLVQAAEEAGIDPDLLQACDRLDEAVAAAVTEAAADEEYSAAVLVTGSVTVVGEARILLGLPAGE